MSPIATIDDDGSTRRVVIWTNCPRWLWAASW